MVLPASPVYPLPEPPCPQSPGSSHTLSILRELEVFSRVPEPMVGPGTRRWSAKWDSFRDVITVELTEIPNSTRELWERWHLPGNSQNLLKINGNVSLDQVRIQKKVISTSLPIQIKLNCRKGEQDVKKYWQLDSSLAWFSNLKQTHT